MGTAACTAAFEEDVCMKTTLSLCLRTQHVISLNKVGLLVLCREILFPSPDSSAPRKKNCTKNQKGSGSCTNVDKFCIVSFASHFFRLFLVHVPNILHFPPHTLRCSSLSLSPQLLIYSFKVLLKGDFAIRCVSK